MSSNSFKEKQKQPVLKALCEKCQKPRRRASMASWLLPERSCNCSTSPDLPAQLVPIGNQEPNESNKANQVSQASQVSQTQSAAPDLTPDTVLNLGDRYEVLDFIGEGASGKVYKIFDKDLQTTLAAKILHKEIAQDEKMRQRFSQEASLAMTLTHENLVGMYGLNSSPDGTPFIVMDFLEGKSLDVLLKEEGSLSEERFISIFTQVLQGLSHAHMSGLIHRDLKPENIFVCQNIFGVEVVKVIDFGIAKLSETSLRTNHNLTQTGEVFGTPSYMSPEQCLGLEVDARADIYSLGCVMYEAITGKPPFSGRNAVQIISKHLSAEPAGLNIDSSLLNELILQCLSKEVTDRPQSAQQVLISLLKIEPMGERFSIAFNLTALKKFIRTGRIDVLPSMRLSYGILNWVITLTIVAIYVISLISPFLTIHVLLNAICGLVCLIAVAGRKEIRRVTHIVETSQPIQAELVASKRMAASFSSLLFNDSSKTETFLGENNSSDNLMPHTQCNTWVDESGNRVAVEVGNTALLQLNLASIIRQFSWWFTLIVATVAIVCAGGLANPIEFMIEGIIIGAFIIIGFSKGIHRRDVPAIITFGYTIPILVVTLCFYTSQLLQQYFNLHIPIPVEQVQALQNYANAMMNGYYGKIFPWLWLFFGATRLLEHNRLLKIRVNKSTPVTSVIGSSPALEYESVDSSL